MLLDQVFDTILEICAKSWGQIPVLTVGSEPDLTDASCEIPLDSIVFLGLETSSECKESLCYVRVSHFLCCNDEKKSDITNCFNKLHTDFCTFLKNIRDLPYTFDLKLETQTSDVGLSGFVLNLTIHFTYR